MVDKKGINVKNKLGEIICTTLTNYAMPLKRYKIGDVGILLEEKQCQCGSNYTILESIEGRIDDIVITECGKRIGRLDHIFKGINSVKECQIIQMSLKNFKLKLVRSNGFTESNANVIISNLKSRVGDNIDISLEYVSNIERTSRGKFKGVISKIKS